MRRRFLISLSGLAAVLGLVALVWYVLIPEYRPGLQAGEMYGVDVSNHQREVDWQAVADDDISFAYVKATEGRDFVDDRFAAHRSGARQAGLQTGAYHFFTLCSPAKDQAENFLRVAPPDEDSLPPAVDLELAGNCSQRPSKDQVIDEVRTFVDHVERVTAKTVLLYVGEDFQDAYDVKSHVDRKHWQPRPFRRPSGDQWTVWQVSGFAHVEGIEGRADLNIAKADLLPTTKDQTSS